MPTTFDFEAQRVPGEWRALGPGELTVTDTRAKQGRRSLAWSWQQAAPGQACLLCHAAPPAPRDHPRSGVALWIHNAEPIAGDLRICVGSANGVQTGQGRYVARFHLDFAGWRCCRMLLSEHPAEGDEAEPDTAPLEAVAFHPPSEANQGRLLLDLVELRESVPKRSADWQMPHFLGDPGSWWQHRPLVVSREQPRRPRPVTVTNDDRHALTTLRQRYETWLLGSVQRRLDDLPAPTAEQVRHYIEQGWQRYHALGPRTDAAGQITHPGLFAGRDAFTFYDVFYNVMLPLCFDHAFQPRDETRDTLLRLFDWVQDQGWAAGSSNGSLALNGLQLAAYCHSVYLMRHELAETHRLDAHQQAVWWYTSFPKAFLAAEPGYRETNADELRSTLFAALPVILTMPEGPEQVQYLQSWRDWFHSALLVTPRFAGVFKPDGIGWHHRGVYLGAYTGEAYEFTALAMHLFDGTAYAAEPWAKANLAHALRTEFRLVRDYAPPHALRGRMLGHEKYSTEQPEWYGMLAAFGFLALVDGPHQAEMAGLFARLWNPQNRLHEQGLKLRLYDDFRAKETPGRRVLLERLAATDPQPAPMPVGCWIQPWAGVAVVRGETWSAVIKGWSQYIWDFECHPALWSRHEQNVYSRLISHGHVQVLAAGKPDSPAALGCNLDHGWDWARWPGITAPHLTLEKLYDPQSTWQTRWFSDETFCGGASDPDTGLGTFAVKLHDTCHDPSFRATKSYFIFGPHIVCLGTGIQCAESNHPVQTTLSQAFLPRQNAPMRLNGETVTAFPFEHTADAANRDAATRLLDPYDTGFYVPAGQNLSVLRRSQTSRTANNEGPTHGDYAVAYLDHGIAPSDARYQYALLPQTTPEQLDAFAAHPPYRVLQQGEHAHIVEHPAHHAVGYCLFTPEHEIPHGPVARTDTPVAVMIHQPDAEHLTLHVADPDLRLPRAGNLGFLSPEQENRLRHHHTLRLIIRGRWQPTTELPTTRVEKYNDHATAIEIDTADGATVTIPMKRA